MGGGDEGGGRARAADTSTPSSLASQVDPLDFGGFTPLHIASRGASVECVRLLLEHGADGALEAQSGERPCDLAVGKETQDLFRDKMRDRSSPNPKRLRRSFSTNTLALLTLLPAAAEKFYEAGASGSAAAVKELCAGALAKSAPASIGRMYKSGAVKVGKMHVSTK